MRLHLGGQLSFYLSNHPQQVDVELKRPTRLNRVLARLGIPSAEVFLIVVNGELVETRNVRVSQQDEVKLFPAVDGG